MLDQVDVIISTRNRCSELIFTIYKTLNIGILANQIHIIDDASTDGTYNEIIKLFPEVIFYRNEIPLNYIMNRNRLMALTQRRYVLSLDDDSHLLSKTDLEEALSILDSSADYGIFTFHPIEKMILDVKKEDLDNKVQQVRTYIGCGHIIKREVIDIIGFYKEFFEFYCEELDYSIRAFKAGYKVVSQNNLLVHHRVNLDLRIKNKVEGEVYSFKRRSMLGFSNNLIVTALYFPPGLDICFFIYYVMRRFYFFTIKKRDISGFIMGLLRFFSYLPYIFKHKSALSYDEFKKWYRLLSYN